jgi:hypothetical protein
MKRLVLCLVFGVGLAGCASSPSTVSRPGVEVDQQKMALVERAAARTGVRIYWLQPPTKSVPVAGS